MNFPNPLTPADCNLQDFPYMPLDVLRLRDSDMAARTTGEEFRCAVLLWCASWHQVPAASLPDDDVNLAQYAGFGRMVDEWRKVREGALRGWICCADGRLYHPVVAEKANESWLAKHRRAFEKLEDRMRKKNKSRADSGFFPLELPLFEVWVDMGRPLERELFPEEFAASSGGNSKTATGKQVAVPRKGFEFPAENALKGKGEEGNGEGKGTEPIKPLEELAVDQGTAHEETPAPLAFEAIPTSRGAAISLLMRQAGVEGCNAANPIVQEWAANARVTDDVLVTAAAMAKKREVLRPGPNYLKPIVEQLLNPKPVKPRNDWSRSPEGVKRMAKEIGFGDGRVGESTEALKQRIFDELARRERTGVAA